MKRVRQWPATRRCELGARGDRTCAREAEVRRRPRNLGPDELGLVAATLAHVERLLAPEAMPAVAEIEDFGTATRALRRAWSLVDLALDGDPQAERDAASAGELLELVTRLRDTDRAVERAHDRQMSYHLDVVQDALADIADVSAPDRLERECPRSAWQLGFDRCMFSVVDDGTWVATSAHSERQPEWAQELVELGRASPQAVSPTLPEFELARRARDIVVTDVHHNANVHRMMTASRSRSYVAAGVRVAGRLQGFIHGDRFFQRASVDDLDAGLMSTFAQGFGFLYARALLADDACRLSSRIAELASGIRSAAGADARDPSDAPRTHVVEPSRAPQNPPLATVETGLTARESEIWRLMATGAGNGDIGRRLYISTDTVKTHVRSIYRKLGVSNRAEAVARWFAARS